ncbi:sugar ABC transporter ATPase [Microbacterium sp. 22242]|uniref:sugar ABC transporter ATPase n=1 Tax=Microbacterium sp. 22242 TaxID=3453896 RepID=UPI003F875860
MDSSTPDTPAGDSADDNRPLRDRDATAEADPRDDPAEAEWERTDALDAGAGAQDIDPATATGADPDEIPAPDDEIPAEDQPGPSLQPETQGDDPLIAELGEDGDGDLAPEDL